MVFFNYGTMQMAAKVVYYGPGLCGKTTNLQYIYGHTSNDSRGEMVSLETETDRTLFFDLLPIDIGTIGGFATRIQLYTVPGQVFYNTTRKLVLKGVDGVVFVADSQQPMVQANVDSLNNLEENLGEIGLTLDEVPIVLQYNKRDLPNICSVDELNAAVNRGNWPHFEASALTGQGVFETLKGISKLTLVSLKRKLAKDQDEDSGSVVSPPPGRPTPPPVKPIAPVGKPASATPAAPNTPAATTEPAAEGDDGGAPIRRSARDSVPPPEPIQAPELSSAEIAASRARAAASQDPASGELAESSSAGESAKESVEQSTSGTASGAQPFPALASEPGAEDLAGPDSDSDDGIFAAPEAPAASVLTPADQAATQDSTAGAQGAAGDTPPPAEEDPFVAASEDSGEQAEMDPFAPDVALDAASPPAPVAAAPTPADEPAATAAPTPPEAAPTAAAPNAATPTAATPTAATPNAATPVPSLSVPPSVATAPVTAAASAAPPAGKRRRRSLDALGELEKLRQQVKAPRAGRANGHGEMSREIQLTVARADFPRLRRVRLSLQVEDDAQQVLEAVRDLDVEIQGKESLDRLLLRLNVALSARD